MEDIYNYILIGVVEDEEIGLSPTDVMIAASNELEPLEDIQEFYQDENGALTFEAFSGTSYVVTDARIEWVH